MSFLKQHASGIILCLFEVLVGILLLIDPVGFTAAIITILGIVLLVVGLLRVIAYFRLDAVEAAVGQQLAVGLIALVAGALCTFKSGWVLSIFPLLTILYGVAILVAGLGKIQWTVDAIRLKTGKWLLPAISALVSILCAVVVLSDPFISTITLWIFTGISLIVEAILDAVVLILGKGIVQE